MMNKFPEINNYIELEVFLDDADYYSYDPIPKDVFNNWLMLILNKYKEEYSEQYRYYMGEWGHIVLDHLYEFALVTNGFDLRETNKCTDMWYS